MPSNKNINNTMLGFLWITLVAETFEKMLQMNYTQLYSLATLNQSGFHSKSVLL